DRLVHRFVWLLRGSTWLFHACGLAYLVRGFSVGVLRLLGGTQCEAYALGHRGVESIVAEGRASGLLTDYQSAMADRVMRLADLTVGDIAIGLAEAMTAPESISREDLSTQVARRSYSRLPLLDTDGRVTGVLDVFDFLTAPKDRLPNELAQAPLLLPNGASLTAALVAIQRSGQALAVVTGAGDRHIGIITAKDITEQIVGELNTADE
ncbi:MAG: CBS domain-containing protein, partial [Planctomycetota bacterium]